MGGHKSSFLIRIHKRLDICQSTGSLAERRSNSAYLRHCIDFATVIHSARMLHLLLVSVHYVGPPSPTYTWSEYNIHRVTEGWRAEDEYATRFTKIRICAPTAIDRPAILSTDTPTKWYRSFDIRMYQLAHSQSKNPNLWLITRDSRLGNILDDVTYTLSME